MPHNVINTKPANKYPECEIFGIVVLGCLRAQISNDAMTKMPIAAYDAKERRHRPIAFCGHLALHPHV